MSRQSFINSAAADFPLVLFSEGRVWMTGGVNKVYLDPLQEVAVYNRAKWLFRNMKLPKLANRTIFAVLLYDAASYPEIMSQGVVHNLLVTTVLQLSNMDPLHNTEDFARVDHF